MIFSLLSKANRLLIRLRDCIGVFVGKKRRANPHAVHGGDNYRRRAVAGYGVHFDRYVPANASSFDRKGLAMTSPSTIGYLATKLGFSEIWRWCGQLSEESQLAETIRNYMGQVKSFGIEPRDLDDLVSGAEIIVDRDPKADSLNGAHFAPSH